MFLGDGSHKLLFPNEQENKNHLIVVEGDFIKTYIIVQIVFFAFVALLVVLFKLRKHIKQSNLRKSSII